MEENGGLRGDFSRWCSTRRLHFALNDEYFLLRKYDKKPALEKAGQSPGNPM
jgi:hypothetical protein